MKNKISNKTLIIVTLIIVVSIAAFILIKKQNAALMELSQNAMPAPNSKIPADDPAFRFAVMDAINAKRTEKGIPLLSMDNTSCMKAKKAAEVHAQIYPEKIKKMII